MERLSMQDLQLFCLQCSTLFCRVSPALRTTLNISLNGSTAGYYCKRSL